MFQPNQVVFTVCSVCRGADSVISDLEEAADVFDLENEDPDTDKGVCSACIEREKKQATARRNLEDPTTKPAGMIKSLFHRISTEKSKFEAAAASWADEPRYNLLLHAAQMRTLIKTLEKKAEEQDPEEEDPDADAKLSVALALRNTRWAF